MHNEHLKGQIIGLDGDNRCILPNNSYLQLIKAHDKFYRATYDYFIEYFNLPLDDPKRSKWDRDHQKKQLSEFVKAEKEYNSKLADIVADTTQDGYGVIESNEMPPQILEALIYRNLQDSKFTEYSIRYDKGNRPFGTSFKDWAYRIIGLTIGSLIAWALGGVFGIYVWILLSTGFYGLRESLGDKSQDMLRLMRLRAIEVIPRPKWNGLISNTPYAQIVSEKDATPPSN